MSKRVSTSNMDPASIWAELDDSDVEATNDTAARSSLLTRFSVDPIQNRPRSKSNALRLPSGWGPRRTPYSAHEARNKPRRTSLSGTEHALLLPKRRTPVQPTAANNRGQQPVSTGYGASFDTSHNPLTPQESEQPQSPDTARDRLLAGSRNALGVWRTGIQYLARLTGASSQRRQEREEPLARERAPLDPEANPINRHAPDQ